MEALKSLDDVAYVRFASVYRNFREAKDFHDVARRAATAKEDARAERWPADGARGEEARPPLHGGGAPAVAQECSAAPATNPSVGTLIVRDDGAGPVIVGSGVTAVGGRPHAETEALGRGRRAGARRHRLCHAGTLRPSRPHAALRRRAGRRRRRARGRRGASDPDPRVSGKGYAMLRARRHRGGRECAGGRGRRRAWPAI